MRAGCRDGIEQGVEQHHDQQQAEGNDNRKPLLGFNQSAELTRPFQAVAFLQLHFLAMRACASATVDPRSRPRTLYLIGTKRSVFCR